MIEGGRTFHVRWGQIGRPVLATELIGGVVYEAWTADYLPFGGVHVATGPVPALRFPGQWFQAESGLHQNWRRDYDPTTGRYLQPDPLGLIDGASVYGYARQSPLRYTDPTGECPVCVGIAVVLAAILTPEPANAPGQCDQIIAANPMRPYENAAVPAVGGVGAALYKFLRILNSATAGSGALDDLISGSTLISRSSRLVQLERPGGINGAAKTFDDLATGLGQNVRTVDGSAGKVRVIDLPGGGTASLRDFSSGGRPTIQINRLGDVTIKIRF